MGLVEQRDGIRNPKSYRAEKWACVGCGTSPDCFGVSDSEGDVASEFDATSCLCKAAGGSEGCALGTEVAAVPLRMVEGVQEDALQVDVDSLEDRQVLGCGEVEVIPLRPIDVIQVAFDTRSC